MYLSSISLPQGPGFPVLCMLFLDSDVRSWRTGSGGPGQPHCAKLFRLVSLSLTESSRKIGEIPWKYLFFPSFAGHNCHLQNGIGGVYVSQRSLSLLSCLSTRNMSPRHFIADFSLLRPHPWRGSYYKCDPEAYVGFTHSCHRAMTTTEVSVRNSERRHHAKSLNPLLCRLFFILARIFTTLHSSVHPISQGYLRTTTSYIHSRNTMAGKSAYSLSSKRYFSRHASRML